MRLEGTNLVCVRGGRVVFAELNLSLGGGEALLVTGPNGAGKSSLLRMVAGLVQVVGGRLQLVDGHADRTIAEQAHYLGHQDALKGALTVAENLDFWCRYLGGPGDQTAALTGVGLDGVADLPAAYLSAGQRRRLSIARLIVVPRPIWLLDEPTAALDSAAQATLAVLMQQHLVGGGIILAATHASIGLDGARELRLEAA